MAMAAEISPSDKVDQNGSDGQSEGKYVYCIIESHRPRPSAA